MITKGVRLGPYEVVSLIGTGGMGEVWKAHDARLARDVAIKILPDHLAAEPDRLRRFEQEARAIAGLNHPHICQIYDIGPGYLVLEHIDGAPPRGPLAPAEAMRLGLQIVSALEAAHEHRILHRDLKPANILVTLSGQVKLLDFGLAKLMTVDEDVTRTIEGTVLGTAAYMSPEQAQGLPLDERSDIFSFGAVMYEMLSGSRAFSGSTTVGVLNAVLRDDPPSFQTPSALERIVRRCLQKQPRDRFQTMADVRAAIEHTARQGDARPDEPRPSIAVLPFVNMSAEPENEYFSDGLAEEIINALTHVPGLKVIARTSAFAFKGKPDDIRRIAETLGVAHVLEGSVRKAGKRIRVTAQLIAAADGSHLWSERYDREMADVFAIQDDISQAISGALRIKLTPKPAQAKHTPKLPAYEALLKGRHHMLKHSPVSLARANDCFEQAMVLDPQYAEPHANLGLNCFLSAMSVLRSPRDTMPLIRAEAKEALSLDPSDPGPHFLLGSVAAAYEYDWKVAAVSHMERAVERDPLNAFWRGILASHLTHAGLHDEAIHQANEAVEIDETNIAPHVTLGEAYATIGRWSEAAAALEKAYRLQPHYALSAGMLAGALVHIGAQTRSAEIVREMGEAPRPLIGRVLYHWLCSETDQAADWYERSINARDPFALVFANGPLGSVFRQSPRWSKLAKMMNLPAE